MSCASPFATVRMPAAMDRIDALGHATSLMKQMVRQLVVPGGDEEPKLIFLPVELASGASSYCDEYEPRAAAKQITLERHFPHQATVAYTDRIAAGAVIDNILSNAVKYSRMGGTITVRVHAAAGEGIVSITDSGPGISADDAASILTRGREGLRPPARPGIAPAAPPATRRHPAPGAARARRVLQHAP